MNKGTQVSLIALLLITFTVGMLIFVKQTPDTKVREGNSEQLDFQESGTIEGLEVILRQTNLKASVDQTAIFEVLFSNTGNISIRFPRKIDNFRDCFLVEMMKDGNIVIHDVDKERLLPSVSFPSTSEYFVELKPGMQIVKEYNLIDYFQKPGKYTFRVNFQAKSGFALTLVEGGRSTNINRHNFYSNWISIEVPY